MSARDALIRAYAFGTLRTQSGGDHDIGAKATHDPVRRKSRGKFTDPEHHRESKKKSINTNNIVMNALIAGKIISAGEGKRPHQQAYARVYYSDSPRERDKSILGVYLTERLIEDLNLHMAPNKASRCIMAYCSNFPYYPDEECKYEEFVINYISSLDRGCTTRVGNFLQSLTLPEK